MNRPHVKNYWLDSETFDVLNYERDFKNYCAELENKFKSLDNAYEDCLNSLHFWEEEADKCKRALDKACELFSGMNLCISMGMDLDCERDCKCCWKEWLLKDE